METKILKKLFIYALLGATLSSAGCFYYHSDDYRDPYYRERDYGYYSRGGYYNRGDYPSSRSFHDDTDHRIDQD